MSVKSNHDGTLKESFSLGKGNLEVGFRTNSGVAEYRETGLGGSWKPFDVESKSFKLKDDMTAGDLCRLINDGGEVKMESIGGAGEVGEIKNLSGSYEATATQLDTNTLFILELDLGTGGQCYICTVASGIITKHTSKPFVTGDSISHLSAEKIDDGKVLIGYRDHSDYKGRIRVVTYITNTIDEIGVHSAFSTWKTNQVKIKKLGTDRAIIGWHDGGAPDTEDNCWLRCVSISGLTISSYGTAKLMTANSSMYDIDVISTDKVVMVIRDGDNSNKGTLAIATISTLAIVYSSESVFYDDSMYIHLKVSSIDVDKAFILCGKNDAIGLVGKVVTFTGTTPAYGVEKVFNGATATSIVRCRIVTINTDKVVAVFSISATKDYEKYQIDIDGDTCEISSPTVLANGGAGTGVMDVIKIDTDSFFLIFRGYTAPDYTNGVTGKSNTVLKTGFSGILQEDGSADEIKKFALLGNVSNVHALSLPASGELMPKLYIQEDGSLGATDVSLGSVGYQLSTTEILVAPEASLEAKPYAIIVAPTGGDYSTISNAIDGASDGDTIFVKNGTYTSVGSLTWKDGVSLIGESRDGVVLENASIVIKGDTISNSGTISLTSNNAGVVGVGSSFSTDSVEPGDKIFIESAGLVLEVLSVTDNTNISLIGNYEGNDLSGVAYQIIRTKQNCSFSNMSFIDMDTWGVFDMARCNNIDIFNCNFTSTSTAIRGINIDDDVAFVTISRNKSTRNSKFVDVFPSNPGRTFNIVVSDNVAISTAMLAHFLEASNIECCNNSCNGCESAIDVTNSNNVTISNNIITKSWDTGIRCGGVTESIVSNNSTSNGDSTGIYLTTDCVNIVVIGNISSNNTHTGISIAATSCVKNIVANNIALNNATANYTDSGTGTVSANNITA